MPPPTEPIDFPDLGNEILDVLRAIGKFICDVGTVLWLYVSGAFEAVWMFPPFEAFRNEFVAALIALWEYAVDHPAPFIAICVLAFIVIPTALNAFNVCVLNCLGFRRRDALRDTRVTNYNSTSNDGAKFSRPKRYGAASGAGPSMQA